MNWRYGIHPNNYAIGETEKYYSDMSEKGWELVKCGITLSRFQKTEPKKMRYRVEVVNLKSLEDGHLPEEQIAVYEDCGWEYVISRGYTVDGQTYTQRKWIGAGYPTPSVGSSVTVLYDRNKPSLAKVV